MSCSGPEDGRAGTLVHIDFIPREPPGKSRLEILDPPKFSEDAVAKFEVVSRVMRDDRAWVHWAHIYSILFQFTRGGRWMLDDQLLSTMVQHFNYGDANMSLKEVFKQERAEVFYSMQEWVDVVWDSLGGIRLSVRERPASPQAQRTLRQYSSPTLSMRAKMPLSPVHVEPTPVAQAVLETRRMQRDQHLSDEEDDHKSVDSQLHEDETIDTYVQFPSASPCDKRTCENRYGSNPKIVCPSLVIRKRIYWMLLQHFPLVGLAVKQLRQCWEVCYAKKMEQSWVTAIRQCHCMDDLLVIEKIMPPITDLATVRIRFDNVVIRQELVDKLEHEGKLNSQLYSVIAAARSGGIEQACGQPSPALSLEQSQMTSRAPSTMPSVYGRQSTVRIGTESCASNMDATTICDDEVANIEENFARDLTMTPNGVQSSSNGASRSESDPSTEARDQCRRVINAVLSCIGTTSADGCGTPEYIVSDVAECFHLLGQIDEEACERSYISSQLKKLFLAGLIVRREHSSRQQCYAIANVDNDITNVQHQGLPTAGKVPGYQHLTIVLPDVNNAFACQALVFLLRQVTAETTVELGRNRSEGSSSTNLPEVVPQQLLPQPVVAQQQPPTAPVARAIYRPPMSRPTSTTAPRPTAPSHLGRPVGRGATRAARPNVRAIGHLVSGQLRTNERMFPK